MENDHEANKLSPLEAAVVREIRKMNARGCELVLPMAQILANNYGKTSVRPALRLVKSSN